MRPRDHGRRLRLMLVEDNPDDVLFVEEALRGRSDVDFSVVRDGQQASERLGGEQLPDLVLLDLNLPRKGGHELLEELRAEPRTRGLAVVVFSAGRDEAEIARTYELGASCYVRKPMDIEEYFDSIRTLVQLWSMYVEMPGR